VQDYSSGLSVVSNQLQFSGSGGIASTGSTHGLVIPAGTAVAGAATKVVYASDATNGYAEVNENNTGLSRICTAANGICTGGGGFSGTVTYTASTTASTSDNGKLVIMNCTAACAYTLPATQPSTTWEALVTSQGTTLATIALGGSDTFNGTTSVPALNSFRILTVAANSATTTDYRGDAPLVAGSGITFTPSANGLSVAASASAPAFSAITTTANAPYWIHVSPAISGNQSTYTVGGFSINPSTGAMVVPGLIAAGGTTAGYIDLPGGGAATPATGSILIQAPSTVTTAYTRTLAGTAASGVSYWTNSSGVMTEGILTPENVVTFSATPTFSATSLSNTITLTGNVTSSTLAAGFGGQTMTLTVCQDATGSRTFVFPTNWHGAMTIGTTASKCSAQPATYSVNQSAWEATSAGVLNE
jgi:hypothetical protein